jgi:hypothetical protein
LRPAAIPPQKFSAENGSLYYPIDPQAMGTWFCAKSNGDVIVLLNGADKMHIPSPPYRNSRGLVLLEIAGFGNLTFGWEKIELESIEPFTLVLCASSRLFQCRWNGATKAIIELDASTPRIWSSTTLYSAEVIASREKWFKEFLAERKGILTSESLMAFHTQTQSADKVNGLIINRAEQLLTKSVTQCVIENDLLTINHFDLNKIETSIIKERVL